MKITTEYLSATLEEYKNDYLKSKKELSSLPSGQLTKRKYENSESLIYTIDKRKTGGKCVRRAIDINSSIARQLARKKFLEAKLSMLKSEIETLSTYVKQHADMTVKEIIASLPQPYRELPEEYFLGTFRNSKTWADEPYEKSDYRTEEKIHMSTEGLWVRSKSELLISERLYKFEVPFRYEATIWIDGYQLSPDFTLLTRSGKIKYWEHMGLMHIPEYNRHNKWKLSMYEEIGIVPWKNLILTYDTEDGGINLAVIEAEIKNKLLI